MKRRDPGWFIAWIWPQLRPLVVEVVRVMLEEERQRQHALSAPKPVHKRYIGQPDEEPKP